MSRAYNKLLKIKKPVLIEIYSKFHKNEVIKYRILYPSGKCEYTNVFEDCFKLSCFSQYDLNKTVEAMKAWDHGRKIKIKEL